MPSNRLSQRGGSTLLLPPLTISSSLSTQVRGKYDEFDPYYCALDTCDGSVSASTTSAAFSASLHPLLRLFLLPLFSVLAFVVATSAGERLIAPLAHRSRAHEEGSQEGMGTIWKNVAGFSRTPHTHTHSE